MLSESDVVDAAIAVVTADTPLLATALGLHAAATLWRALGKPLAGVAMGRRAAHAEAADVLRAAGIAVYEDVAEAAACLGAPRAYARWRERTGSPP